ILGLFTQNDKNYLVPFRNVVNSTEGTRPSQIERTDFKRTTKIYSDLRDGHNVSPLEVANILEQQVFPELESQFPSASLRFRGEVEESRETQSEFGFAILLVVFVIYFILVVLFDSL